MPRLWFPSSASRLPVPFHMPPGTVDRQLTPSPAVRAAGDNRLRNILDPDTPAGRLESNAAVPPLRVKDHLVFTQLPDKGKIALYPGQSQRVDYIGVLHPTLVCRLYLLTDGKTLLL